MRTGTIAGAVGVLATVLSVGVVLAPGTVLSIGPVDRAVTLLATRDPRVVLLVVGAAAGVVALAVSRSASRQQSVDDGGPRQLVTRPPESVATDGPDAPGSTLDEQLGRVEADATAPQAAVRETLKATAVRRLARVDGDAERARRAVEAGDWTDDDLVASFVGEGPVPLSARVRAWLDPGAEHRRRVERTVAAIERLGEDEP